MDIDFHLTRELKRGGLGKGRSINASHLFNTFYHPDYMQPEDIRICQLLNAAREGYAFNCEIRGELGAIVLNMMLRTGRCFAHDFDRQPLQPGDIREMTTQWLRHHDGSAELDLSITPVAMLLPTEPALYLDTERGEVGPLRNAEYTAAQIRALLSAPRVPAENVAEFSRRIAVTFAPEVLPAPQSVTVEEISGQVPIPYLMLSAREDGQGCYHLMRLRFSYGMHQIPVLPEVAVAHISAEQKLFRIHRNLDEEQLFIDQLWDLGFEGRSEPGSGDVYFLSLVDTLIESANRWHAFLTGAVPRLQQQGWQIEFDASFCMQFHEPEQWDVAVDEEGHDWFNLRFDIDLNGQKLPLLPIIARVLEQFGPDEMPDILTVNIDDSDYLRLPAEQIRPIIDILYELFDQGRVDDDGAMKLSRFDAGHLSLLEESGSSHLAWHGGEALRKLGAQLQNFDGIQPVQPPQGLEASLRPYQQLGLNWLQFLRAYQLGGILADDMGLGKTVQTLAHLMIEKEQGRLDRPCLIIAPTSLMGNWRREAERFTPDLRVLVLHGPERHQLFEQIGAYDLILSTYPLLVRDHEALSAIDYHMLVLDEAQTVKNPKAKAAKVIRTLATRHRLCLTGTPMENHLGELWALFDFLMPGFLGDMGQFNSLFRTPIEKHHDQASRTRLVRRITPFMLRRTKAEVAHELPEKTEIVRTVMLDKAQAALYESIRLAMEEKVRNTIASKGLARSHITILDALLKLRQVCCDPRLLSLKQAQRVKESAKLALLMQMLPELLEEGRRILLFSQFTKMLGLIEEELHAHSIPYTKLTGQTRKRDEAIDLFRSGSVNLFLISLKAGGVGLNLTEADTVIHYDPWWNPAAEHQATDRAHRIGQDKAVFVYKFVVENSVEEKIVAMQAQKQALAEGVYRQEQAGETSAITADDLQQLLSPL